MAELTVKLEAERKARNDVKADQKAPVQKAKELAELTMKLEAEWKARHDAESKGERGGRTCSEAGDCTQS